MCRELDVHGRYGVEGPRDDGIRAELRPQFVSTTEELREALEDRIWLALSLGKATSELLDCVQVALAEVVNVHEARRIEGNEVAVFVSCVAVRGLCEGTSAVQNLSDKRGCNVGGPGGQFLGELTAELGIAKVSG